MPARTLSIQSGSLNPHGLKRKVALRPLTQAERKKYLWRHGNSHEFHDSILDVTDIDDPYPYVFQEGDIVWFKSDNGTWNKGRVLGMPRMGSIGPEDNAINIYYLVEYRVNERPVRKYVAPMNGEVKPETVQTRKLLLTSGFKTITDFRSLQ